MQTVTIAAGTNSTTVNIPVNDDGIPEKDEVFNITLSLPSSLNGAGVVLANDNAIVSATGTIIDSSECYCCTDIYVAIMYCKATNFQAQSFQGLCRCLLTLKCLHLQLYYRLVQ